MTLLEGTTRKNRVVLCVKAALAEPKLLDEYLILVEKKTGIPQFDVSALDLERAVEILCASSEEFASKIRPKKSKMPTKPPKATKVVSSDSSSSSDSSNESDSEGGGLDLGFSDDEARPSSSSSSSSSDDSEEEVNKKTRKTMMKKKLAGLAAARRLPLKQKKPLKPKPPPTVDPTQSKEEAGQDKDTEKIGETRSSSEIPKTDRSIGERNGPQSDTTMGERNGPQSDTTMGDRNVPQSDTTMGDRNVPQTDTTMGERNVPQTDRTMGEGNVGSHSKEMGSHFKEMERGRKLRQSGGSAENVKPSNLEDPNAKRVRVQVQVEAEGRGKGEGVVRTDWSSDFGRLIRQAIDNKRVCPFRTLGLAPGSSMSEVKKRWAKLCLLLHPDKAPMEWKSVPELVDANQAINEAKKSIEQKFQAVALSRPQRPAPHPVPYTLDKGTFGKRRVEVRWIPSPISNSREKVERYLVFLMHGQDLRRRDQMLSAGSVKEGTDPFFVIVEDDQRYAKFFNSNTNGGQITVSILASNAAGNSDPLTIIVPLK